MSALDRRQFLHTLAAATCALSAPAVARAAAAPDFSYAVVTDFHYRDARCSEWGERLVAQLNATRPRLAFVCLAGDITDNGTEAECHGAMEVFQGLRVPMHALIGNHDYTEDGASTAYRDTFQRELNYRFRVGEHEFLALDTTQGRDVYRTRIGLSTLEWLQRTLPSVSRQRPLTVLTHFPLGLNYLRPWNAYQVLGLLKGHAFTGAHSGHWHGLTRRVEHGIPLETGRCASWWRTNHDGSDERGYILCQVRDGVTTSQFMPVSRTGLRFVG